MLRRFLMFGLITCILGYGSVWAFEHHLDEAAEHHGTVGDTDHAPKGDAAHPACDHCCHAAAHIMALCPASIETVHAVTGTGYTPYRHGAFFRPTAPPDRPPRS